MRLKYILLVYSILLLIYPNSWTHFFRRLVHSCPLAQDVFLDELTVVMKLGWQLDLVWVAAVHGGAGHIRVGRDQLALGQVQDIRNIVAKSVSPRLSGKTEIKCYFLMFAEVTFTCGPVDWHHKDYGRRWMSVFLWVFYEYPGWGPSFPHRMPEWTLGDNDLRISASPWRINYKYLIQCTVIFIFHILPHHSHIEHFHLSKTISLPEHRSRPHRGHDTGPYTSL